MSRARCGTQGVADLDVVEQGQQKPLLVRVQRARQVADHLFARDQQIIQRHRLSRHALEGALVVLRNVAFSREQNFMNGPVVARQVTQLVLEAAQGCPGS